MTIFRIPRVCVFIPGETSRVKFVPEYEYPLFQKIYRNRVADAHGNPLRLIPHPKGAPPEQFWYEPEIEDFEELLGTESMRLRQSFGQDERTGETVFDTVYIGDMFATALKAAIDSADKHASDPLRADPLDRILPLCTQVGIDRATARRLAQIGWRNAEELSGADHDQLTKIVGKVKAALLIRAAETAVNALINASPSEQIAGAKAAARGKE